MLNKARQRAQISVGPRSKKIGASLRKRLPKDLSALRNFDTKKLAQYPALLRWGFVVFLLYLLSGIAAKTIGLFVRPSYTPVPPKRVAKEKTTRPRDDYDAILRRNMFNVQGKIPEAFDQGLLDCFSQARPTTQRLVLHGTIVTSHDAHSVALIQEEGKTDKIAVKKDDTFFDKFLALKVERKRLCFQVQSSQELEFIQIPEENVGFGMGTSLEGKARTEGITPISETNYVVNRKFLDEKLSNLNQILQTARAVPYVDPGTNKFRGFLVQTIDPDSPFASLGIRQGDILTGVNDILLDNPGKGLEAFNKLRSLPKVSLKVIRGGQEYEFSYDVK